MQVCLALSCGALRSSVRLALSILGCALVRLPYLTWSSRMAAYDAVTRFFLSLLMQYAHLMVSAPCYRQTDRQKPRIRSWNTLGIVGLCSQILGSGLIACPFTRRIHAAVPSECSTEPVSRGRQLAHRCNS
jgi:hypothetical protein